MPPETSFRVISGLKFQGNISTGIETNNAQEQTPPLCDFVVPYVQPPAKARAFVGRGLARMHKGDPDGAIADYSKGIELNPRGFLAFFNRALARKQRGDLDGAIADLSQALEINSADVEAWFGRAILRGARCDLDGALANYAKAIELNPLNARAYANRGMIMLVRGQDVAAQKEFDTALQIDSSLKADLNRSITQILNARKR